MRVVVTGTSRGIGLEFTRQYVQDGARVFAGCRHPENAAALRALEAGADGRLTILQMDVTRVDEIAQSARALAVAAGAIDLLINNAGISVAGERAENLDPAVMVGLYHTNAAAPMIVAREMRPLLQKGDAPKIVNISSTMGSLEMKRGGGFYSYSASKAALNIMTLALAHDLREEGIVVCALHPGWVKTDLGGRYAELPVEESVRAMRAVIGKLTLQDTALFYTWKGEKHPW